MDRRELLDKTARSEEERLLLSRVWDKREQCRLRSIPAATAFLSPQEQAAATRLRRNMLSTTAQYLSARHTMKASRQVGTWRKVSGHMWLAMMSCSFLVMWNTRWAFTQA